MLGSNFKDLVGIMETLMSKDGCPWDKEQTHDSLKSCLIEEVYEIVDAVDSKDSEGLKEELADLFFLIIFYSKIADDNNNFDINNVLESCLEKMTRRHPHVFGDKSAKNASEALNQWNEIKKKEKEAKQSSNKSIVDNVPNHMPALQKAQKIQQKVASVGFDWEAIDDVIEKVHEELEEVKEAIKNKEKEPIAEEIGDLLFAVVSLSRFLKLDSEDLLRKGISKFSDRFKKVEMRVASLGKEIEDCSLAELDGIWNEIKS